MHEVLPLPAHDRLTFVALFRHWRGWGTWKALQANEYAVISPKTKASQRCDVLKCTCGVRESCLNPM